MASTFSFAFILTNTVLLVQLFIIVVAVLFEVIIHK